MNLPRLLALALLCLTLPELPVRADAAEETSSYVWPKEPAVLQNLRRWQGFKFGLLIHQGLYSHLGIVESWELCPEDWVERPGYEDYYAFARDYRNTKTVFNPAKFDPAKWARAFRDGGAKYVIYTTKHHDGFCLFDTAHTDFKVTDKSCPFSSNARSNLVREVFDACRAQGLAVGAYFSKPDWSSPYFWWPYYPPHDRNPSYDITKHPDRWKQFIDYTRAQLQELTSDYGPLDILWLDGCWVRPKATINPKVAEFCQYPHDLDIHVNAIAEAARRKNPGLLVVDRWVPGENENYLTPEQKVPEQRLAVPWESCITMGNSWGWTPNDKFKTSRELIQQLVKVVAKGGNLLLGIGPNAQGEFPSEVYTRLREMGAWLQANGEAIYNTEPAEPFQDGQLCYTRNGQTVYAIYLPLLEEKRLPESLLLRIGVSGKISVSLPGLNSQTLRSHANSEGLRIEIPGELRPSLAAKPAVVIQIGG
jgi:alpha-L-fucosidase